MWGSRSLLDPDLMTQSKQISVNLHSLWYFLKDFSVSDSWYRKNILVCYSTIICSLGVWNKLQKLLQFVLCIFCGFLNALSLSLVLPSWTVATKTILQYSLPVGSSPITIITPLVFCSFTVQICSPWVRSSWWKDLIAFLSTREWVSLQMM